MLGENNKRNVEDFYAMPDSSFSWFPENWAGNAAEAIQALIEVDPGHVEADPNNFTATKTFGRVGRNKRGESWFWVCKETHPKAQVYWQVERSSK